MPIYFFLNTIKRRMNNAVVGRVVFNELMNERHNNREAASDNNAQKFISHDTKRLTMRQFRRCLNPTRQALRARFRGLVRGL